MIIKIRNRKNISVLMEQIIDKKIEKKEKFIFGYSDQLYGLGPINNSKIAGNNTKIPPQ